MEPTPQAPDPPEALREATRRIAVLEERIVLYREVPVMTPVTVRAMMTRLEEVIAPWPTFVFVLDLSTSERPDAEARAELFRTTRELAPRMWHMAVVIKGNLILRALVQVFSHTLGYRSVSLHDTLDEAIDAARRSLRP